MDSTLSSHLTYSPLALVPVLSLSTVISRQVDNIIYDDDDNDGDDYD